MQQFDSFTNAGLFHTEGKNEQTDDRTSTGAIITFGDDKFKKYKN